MGQITNIQHVILQSSNVEKIRPVQESKQDVDQNVLVSQMQKDAKENEEKVQADPKSEKVEIRGRENKEKGNRKRKDKEKEKDSEPSQESDADLSEKGYNIDIKV